MQRGATRSFMRVRTFSMRRTVFGISALAMLLVASACRSSGGSDQEPSNETSAAGQSASAQGPQRGGSLTVLEDKNFAGGWPAGLDPATNTNGGANLSQNQAIFGGLFLLRSDDDGSNAHVAP